MIEGMKVFANLNEKGICRRDRVKHITTNIFQVCSLRQVRNDVWKVKHRAFDVRESSETMLATVPVSPPTSSKEPKPSKMGL
ncbi:hypothetical protein SLA2020_425420 [Shorea laevis]